MISVNNPNIEFKILPDDSDYIIGSNSKNAIGEFYSLNIDLNILQKSAKRNKRVFDLGIGMLLLFMSPILMWLTKKPLGFLSNIFKVLVGNATWVGFSKNISVAMPQINEGIVHPVSYLESAALDQSTINRINMLYAKNYTVYSDLTLMMKSFRNLGI